MLMLLTLLPATEAWASSKRAYRMDIGLQAGGGYYVGDATEHIFNNPLDVYGAHLRYKFDQRWSLQAKTMRQRITCRNEKNAIHYNALWNTDLCAEFNFFRFGVDDYDSRIKPITPYIFLGFGVAVYGKNAMPSPQSMYPLLIGQNSLTPTVACYFPFGFGGKWKFAERWQLHVSWQHNLYFADDIEGLPEYNNKHQLNGSNILNFDLTGQLTVGIVFEMAKEKKICLWCDE